jgi:heme-degrading monooxygenase HmoA
MAAPYSYGVWVVKAGFEEEFVVRWRDLAEWTATNMPGAGVGRLLQDESQPGRFISFGEWESREAMAGWRSTLGFQERISRLRDLLETFTPASLELRAEVDPDVVAPRRPAYVDRQDRRREHI